MPDRPPSQPIPLRVLHPCTRSWDSLEGDRRRRYCDDCKLHVWNTSELTEAEARSIMSGTERVCMSGMAKADGQLLTKERLRQEARRVLKRHPLLRLAAALGLISIPTALNACWPLRTGGVVASPTGGRVQSGEEDVPRQVMPGDIAPLPPPTDPSPPAPPPGPTYPTP